MKSDDYKIDTDVPFYDPEILTPNHVLITHLVETFFVHFGCSFPFLQRERFLRDVDEKRVDTILVDAVCAIAARFSNHPLLTSPTRSRAEELGTRGTVSRPDHGLYFAQRAKSAVTKTFSCPSMPIVQACILLAYEEFGSNHDSGLWMYLGIAIRMAQDLGMEKLEGIRFGGQDGPTPKTVKYNNNGEESRDVQVQHNPSPPTSEPDSTAIEDQKMTERERVDTFWAVFFMDRVVCSGTGRPVTLRDKDVELSFPSQDESDPQTGWPMPFPALIRIIHLYGRVTDLLNSIKEINHVTPDTLKRLTGMEKALTGIYQRLSPRLHFSVANFQHYVHVQQGTIFILLHFWFHALIVVLHQPTLLHSFDERIQQSFSDNRELSVSSAKTIADILAFAELLDAKSIVGSPFTSQPIYIAACAFLAEKAVHAASQPIPHRTASSAALMPGGPHTSSTDVRQSAQNVTSHVEGLDAKTAKYTLLATAAHQNYQRCHKALESLENYWAGTKYIITVLDQKAKGVGNPLLYTTEEMETAIDVSRSAAPYTTPPWKRKSGNQAQASSAGEIRSPREANLPKARSDQEGQMHLETPPMDPSLAIGWSLTGTTNSPNSSLTFLYQTSNGDNGHVSALSRPPSLSLDSVQRLDHLPSDFVSTTAETAHPKRQISLFPQTKTEYSIPLSSPDVLLPTTGQLGDSPSSHPPHQQQQPPIPLPSMGPIGRTTPHPTAEMLIDLHLPFSAPPPAMPAPAIGAFPSASPPYPVPSSGPQVAQYDPLSAAAFEPYPTPLSHASAFTPAATSINDMMTIQSQDVDVSALSGDMMPWLEYLPQDYLTLFDHGGGGHPPG
ncbi:MAG: hypothetical protein M1817_001068 [Caeruleum heppii]|nr:MAG: hypothetical protein M1817_001068 [Caeruleum heppii]